MPNLDDALKLTLDQIFPKKTKMNELEKQFPVEGYSDNENLWEYVCQCSSNKTFNRTEQYFANIKSSYQEITQEDVNIGNINENSINK